MENGGKYIYTKYIYSMCMKNAKQGYYPTVILQLCCGYHLVMVRYGVENGVETEQEWSGDGVKTE